MSYLVLIRHGESEYNVKGLWTGWDNPSLTEKGHQQARTTANLLPRIQFDHAFTATLTRTKQTLAEVLDTIQQTNIPITEIDEIRERNYGIYTGKNKWQIQQEVGEELFTKMRRSWDYPIPEGESLKQVYERIYPYFETTIKPFILEEKNVIIVTSGNALRALAKHIEGISDEQITNYEFPIAGAVVYTFDALGNLVSREMKGGEIDHPR